MPYEVIYTLITVIPVISMFVTVVLYMHTYRTQTCTISAKVAPDIIMSKYISNSW